MLRKNDIILAVSVILICIGMIVLYNIFGKEGEVVHIISDGYECGVLPLNENAVMRVPDSGRDYNIVVIKDGSVFVSEADCPDSLCVNQGKISRAGETIICLPHKLMVTISGSSLQEDIDGKTY